MKVILLEDIKKVGKKDEIVEVSQGYGHNFLIKNKKAIEANSSTLHELEIKKAKEKNLEESYVLKAQKLKEKIEKEKFVFHLNVGNNGNVFGKISTKQIAKKLQDLGYNIDRKKIKTQGVGHLGEEKIEIVLHKKVISTITIEIIGD